MTVKVPAQYQTYVANAAKELGIPQSVVAAQISLESGFNPNAVSPAGAEGIAQFEPGTFASYGSGSPFDVSDAFSAYVNYMKELLKKEGTVKKALEAYNAGPGNLSAGEGYADKILSNADVPSDTASSGTSGGTSAVGDISSITGFFGSAVDDLSEVFSLFTAFFRPSTYIRIGAGTLGVIFLILAFVGLGIETFKE